MVAEQLEAQAARAMPGELAVPGEWVASEEPTSPVGKAEWAGMVASAVLAVGTVGWAVPGVGTVASAELAALVASVGTAVPAAGTVELAGQEGTAGLVSLAGMAAVAAPAGTAVPGELAESPVGTASSGALAGMGVGEPAGTMGRVGRRSGRAPGKGRPASGRRPVTVAAVSAELALAGEQEVLVRAAAVRAGTGN